MPPKSPARDIASFRDMHDSRLIAINKIKAAFVGMLKEGRENWEYESEFVRRSGISQTQLGQLRETFSAHIVETPHMHGKLPKRVWFADFKVAKQVRDAAKE